MLLASLAVSLFFLSLRHFIPQGRHQGCGPLSPLELISLPHYAIEWSLTYALRVIFGMAHASTAGFIQFGGFACYG